MANRAENVKISLVTSTIPVGQRAENVKISLVTNTIPIGCRAESVKVSLRTHFIATGKPRRSFLGLKPKIMWTSSFYPSERR